MVRDDQASGTLSDGSPDVPSGHPPLLHAAIDYREKMEVHLAEKHLLKVALGQPPASCRQLIDHDMSLILLADPNLPQRDFLRLLEIHMRCERDNSVNAAKRYELDMNARTECFGIISKSCERNQRRNSVTRTHTCRACMP